MLARHRDKLRPLNPDTPETRALQLLTEDRRQLVNERMRYSNRLTANLKSYYPQVLQWFGDLYAPVTNYRKPNQASFSRSTTVETPKINNAWRPYLRR